MVGPGSLGSRCLHPRGAGRAGGGGERGLDRAAGGGLVEEGGEAPVEGLGEACGHLGVVAAF